MSTEHISTAIGLSIVALFAVLNIRHARKQSARRNGGA